MYRRELRQNLSQQKPFDVCASRCPESTGCGKTSILDYLFPGKKREIHTTKCLAKNIKISKERNRYKIKNSNTIQTHKYCEIKQIDNMPDIVRVHTRSVRMLLQLILSKEFPIGMALCGLFEFL